MRKIRHSSTQDDKFTNLPNYIIILLAHSNYTIRTPYIGSRFWYKMVSIRIGTSFWIRHPLTSYLFISTNILHSPNYPVYIFTLFPDCLLDLHSFGSYSLGNNWHTRGIVPCKSDPDALSSPPIYPKYLVVCPPSSLAGFLTYVLPIVVIDSLRATFLPLLLMAVPHF